MKFVTLVFAFSISSFAFAANTCLDLSGKYALPTNTAEQKTTLIFSQGGCDQITITGTHFSAGGGVTLLPTNHYSLNGGRPRNCHNGILQTCASYKVLDGKEICKTLSELAFADGGERGACQYTTSILSKDVHGNLVESIMDARCEDGYVGRIKPIVFTKLH